MPRIRNPFVNPGNPIPNPLPPGGYIMQEACQTGCFEGIYAKDLQRFYHGLVGKGAKIPRFREQAPETRQPGGVKAGRVSDPPLHRAKAVGRGFGSKDSRNTPARVISLKHPSGVEEETWVGIRIRQVEAGHAGCKGQVWIHLLADRKPPQVISIIEAVIIDLRLVFAKEG